MRVPLVLLLLVHGAIHLLGFAKGLDLAEVPQLQRAIDPREGLLWLLAALVFWGTAALLLVGVQGWWVGAAFGILLSQALIFGAWSDARFGTLANLLILLPLLVGLLNHVLPPAAVTR